MKKKTTKTTAEQKKSTIKVKVSTAICLAHTCKCTLYA